jgi:UDP-N-acetylmuramate: L-alanyl-gamma-D-glutamyl-meso-diaminopimelate ligase
LNWSLDSVLSEAPVPATVTESLDDIIAKVASHKGEPLSVVVMSNGGFGGIHQKLLDALAE